MHPLYCLRPLAADPLVQYHNYGTSNKRAVLSHLRLVLGMSIGCLQHSTYLCEWFGLSGACRECLVSRTFSEQETLPGPLTLRRHSTWTITEGILRWAWGPVGAWKSLPSLPFSPGIPGSRSVWGGSRYLQRFTTRRATTEQGFLRGSRITLISVLRFAV